MKQYICEIDHCLECPAVNKRTLKVVGDGKRAEIVVGLTCNNDGKTHGAECPVCGIHPLCDLDDTP